MLCEKGLWDKTNFTMYGGVVMNKVIGGVNPGSGGKRPEAGSKVIWLPTQSARRHLEKMGKNPDEGIQLVRDGKVIPELETVFGLIKDHDAVLATAHVSPEEAFVVVEAARRRVEKIVITHPEWWVCGYTLEDQIRLVKDYDVILERCYAQNMGKGKKYHMNLRENAELIQAVGYRHVWWIRTGDRRKIRTGKRKSMNTCITWWNMGSRKNRCTT